MPTALSNDYYGLPPLQTNALLLEPGSLSQPVAHHANILSEVDELAETLSRLRIAETLFKEVHAFIDEAISQSAKAGGTAPHRPLRFLLQRLKSGQINGILGHMHEGVNLLHVVVIRVINSKELIWDEDMRSIVHLLLEDGLEVSSTNPKDGRNVMHGLCNPDKRIHDDVVAEERKKIEFCSAIGSRSACHNDLIRALDMQCHKGFLPPHSCVYHRFNALFETITNLAKHIGGELAFRKLMMSLTRMNSNLVHVATTGNNEVAPTGSNLWFLQRTYELSHEPQYTWLKALFSQRNGWQVTHRKASGRKRNCTPYDMALKTVEIVLVAEKRQIAEEVVAWFERMGLASEDGE
ncbi:hypothetical protein HK097_000320 [Rhizophlyctis rosea]|uniref:Uncharacterized protein n=1 Tax=Rhizophlyctis rosea TaxID=64517 RepID=A0AAD5S8N9_9FUNG|nr:hypothetical protein HK097_000320 [Rhizophlyctis rosea]